MKDKLQELNRRGWSHDELAWLICASRPTVRKILDGKGEDILSELQCMAVDSVLASELTHKKFVEHAKGHYRIEIIRRFL